jgi:hypothetical protein
MFNNSRVIFKNFNNNQVESDSECVIDTVLKNMKEKVFELENNWKNQVEQLRKVTWALYSVYLLQYCFKVYQPVSGMLSGNTYIGVIGIVLTTILVLCITHVSNVCTDANCYTLTAKSSLDRINILLAVLIVVHIGTIVVFMASPASKIGFTAEILELLRTPSRSRSRSSLRRTPDVLPPWEY